MRQGRQQSSRYNPGSWNTLQYLWLFFVKPAKFRSEVTATCPHAKWCSSAMMWAENKNLEVPKQAAQTVLSWAGLPRPQPYSWNMLNKKKWEHFRWKLTDWEQLHSIRGSPVSKNVKAEAKQLTISEQHKVLVLVQQCGSLDGDQTSCTGLPAQSTPRSRGKPSGQAKGSGRNKWGETK